MINTIPEFLYHLLIEQYGETLTNTILESYSQKRPVTLRANTLKSDIDDVKTVFENYEIPYISITPTFSVCPVHGYLSGEHLYCPQCRQEEIHKIDLEEERIKRLVAMSSKTQKIAEKLKKSKSLW